MTEEPEVRASAGAPRPQTHTVELPVCGGALELTTGGLRPTYRFTGEPPVEPGRHSLVDDLLVGARTGGSRRTRWTVAWGALVTGRSAADVVVEFRSDRHGLRRARSVTTPAQPVGARMWVAEAVGRFDEVRVEAGELVETRDLRD